MAIVLSVARSVAMIAAGGLAAWLVYRYMGLKYLSRTWFNLDGTWAVSLILVGAISLAFSLEVRHRTVSPSSRAHANHLLTPASMKTASRHPAVNR
jgi:hypothetical protein